MIFRTPLLVQIEPWADYLAHIAKRARYAYRRLPAGRHEEIPLTRDALEPWMRLWERQRVEGKPPVWTYSYERFHVEHWRLLASEWAVHPILVCGEYVYAGPPLYDKAAHPFAAKFMWFHAVRWCAERGLKWLDLQGPGRQTWRALLESPPPSYKWLYVQRETREHPERAEPWFSQCCPCGWRQLVLRESPCRHCA